MNARAVRSGITLGAICGIAALVGYGLALKGPHAGPSHAAASRGDSSAPSRDAVTLGGANGATDPSKPSRPSAASITPQSRTAEQLAALKEELRREFSDHHNPWMDSILRTRTAALLATMSAEELAAFHGEVNATDDARGGSFFDWQSALAREILRQWGMKDPAAATIAESRTKNMRYAYVFADWLTRDPAAAEKWLMEGDPGTDPVRQPLLRRFMRERAQEDPVAAAAMLGKVPDKDHAFMFRSWSKSLANDPEGRAKLLAMIDARGDEKLREQCYGDVVSSMAEKSPEEAGNFLENSTLSEDAKDRMMDRLIGSWAQKNPSDAFRWWAALKEPTARPGLVAAMKEWYFKDREGPANMIQSLDHGPARSAFEEEAVTHYARLDDFSGATKIAAAIQDDAARIRQMRIIKRYWDEVSKDASAAWLATLPEKDRDAVK